MRPKDELILQLNIDWRILLVIGAIIGLLVLAYSSVHAQDVGPINVNELAEQEAAAQPALAASVDSAPPLVECAEGLLPTANGECVPADSIGMALPQAASASAVAASSGGARHYYLSSANYNGSQVLTACAVGYHLASFWEIQDTSNLTYDYNHPLAYNKADSGFGPPSLWYGWVRTGQDSSGSNVAGTGNCLNWTSNANTNSGVFVRLTDTWETPPGEIGPWDATPFTCNFVGPVWCVGDFYTNYLPQINKN